MSAVNELIMCCQTVMIPLVYVSGVPITVFIVLPHCHAKSKTELHYIILVTLLFVDADHQDGLYNDPFTTFADSVFFFKGVTPTSNLQHTFAILTHSLRATIYHVRDVTIVSLRAT